MMLAGSAVSWQGSRRAQRQKSGEEGREGGRVEGILDWRVDGDREERKEEGRNAEEEECRIKGRQTREWWKRFEGSE